MLSLVLVSMLAQGPAWADPTRVFVSILPLKHFVERIGAEQVSVSTMVGAGHSPATYEPTPKQLTALSAARVYFRIGVPFETAWMDRISRMYPGLPIVDCRPTSLPTVAIEIDPHVWTNPRNTIEIATCIRDALIEVAAGDIARFVARHEEFVAALVALDHDIRRRLRKAGIGEFLVFHPAWGHFARAYGLQQIALEHEGKEPGARALGRLFAHAGARQLDVILIQPQFSRSLAEVAARELDASLIEVDPLAEDYLAGMEALTLALTSGAAR